MKEHGLPIDVFSFAMTMYHIFTGEIPFKEFDNMQVQEQIKQGKRPSMDKPFPNGIPEIIERCWDQDPNKRPRFDAICSKLNDIVRDYSQ